MDGVLDIHKSSKNINMLENYKFSIDMISNKMVNDVNNMPIDCKSKSFAIPYIESAQVCNIVPSNYLTSNNLNIIKNEIYIDNDQEAYLSSINKDIKQLIDVYKTTNNFSNEMKNEFFIKFKYKSLNFEFFKFLISKISEFSDEMILDEFNICNNESYPANVVTNKLNRFEPGINELNTPKSLKDEQLIAENVSINKIELSIIDKECHKFDELNMISCNVAQLNDLMTNVDEVYPSLSIKDDKLIVEDESIKNIGFNIVDEENLNVNQTTHSIKKRLSKETNIPNYQQKNKRGKRTSTLNGNELLHMKEFGHYDELIVKNSKIHGLGVFAPIDIPRNTLIMEYIGEIIGKCMSDKRELIYKRNNIESVYMFSITDDIIIDATLRGNKARYVNHSCNPNCEAIMCLLDKTIKYCSIRDIKMGEELFINYNMERIENKYNINNEECNCGSDKCFSIMKNNDRSNKIGD